MYFDTKFRTNNPSKVNQLCSCEFHAITLKMQILKLFQPSTAGLSNLNQLQAANCQLSLLTGHKSVANVNYQVRSLPLPQRREEKKQIMHKPSKIESKCYDLELFKHFISHVQQINIGPILIWVLLSGPHEIASRATCSP